MATATTPPTEEARSVFADLGYDVSGEGAEFSAVRDWKEVRVTATVDEAVEADPESLCCFVTWDERAPRLRSYLDEEDPACEWAVIGVDDAGEYEVTRAPGAGE
jgi:hypothetical protein